MKVSACPTTFIISAEGTIVDAGEGYDRAWLEQAIEQALTYPGEIKVNVLRETRHIEIAR